MTHSEQSNSPRRVPASLHNALVDAAHAYSTSQPCLGCSDPASVELAEIMGRWEDGSQRKMEIIFGEACIVCGQAQGPLLPVGLGPNGQLFTHRSCWS